MSEPPRILLVDDNDLMRTVMTHTLEHLGYSVVTAEDGQVAYDLVLVHGDRFQLVLSDVDMPRMTGFALRDALRILEPQLPVVLMSGGRFRNCAGVQLTKPFSRHALLACLETIRSPDAAAHRTA